MSGKGDEQRLSGANVTFHPELLHPSSSAVFSCGVALERFDCEVKATHPREIKEKREERALVKSGEREKKNRVARLYEEEDDPVSILAAF